MIQPNLLVLRSSGGWHRQDIAAPELFAWSLHVLSAQTSEMAVLPLMKENEGNTLGYLWAGIPLC